MRKKLIGLLVTALVLTSVTAAFAARDTDLSANEVKTTQTDINSTKEEIVVKDIDSLKRVESEKKEIITKPINIDKDGSQTIANTDSGWKYVGGGRWRHGVNSRHVWSYYDHNTKVHSTTVCGAGGKYGRSGWINAGRRATASWEKARSGNRAWYNVK